MKYRQWMTIGPYFRNLAIAALSAAQCRLCRNPGRTDIGLCSACMLELPWLVRGCRQCSLPIPPESESDICATCLQQPRLLDQCNALFVYQRPIDDWIHDLKFQQQLGNARLLGRLLAEKMPATAASASTTVLPAPLHRRRLIERGYNQSLVIAAALRRHGYRLEPACCRRKKPTTAQSELSAAARKTNIRGAFETTRDVSGEKFLLIDDVMTTGATLEELARTLKRAGADSVEAWVIARAIRPVY